MAKPDIFVTEKGKTSDWIKEYVLHLAKEYTHNPASLKQDIICYNYYNNIHEEADFEYITKVGKRDLPATLNHIPAQRTYIDTLVSEYTLRPFIYSIFVSDEDSLNEKQFNKAKEMYNQINNILNQTLFANEEQINQISQQIQMVNQMANKQPESKEDAQKIQQIKQSLPGFNIQMKMVMQSLSKQSDEVTKQIKDIDRKLTYTYKEAKEEIGQKLLYRYYKLFNIKGKGANNFRHQSITGKQFYYTDYFPEYKDPIFEELEPISVTYPSSSDNEWVQDGPWVKFKKYMSYEDFVIKYGDEFKRKYSLDELKGLEDKGTSNNGNFVSTPEGAMLYDKQPYAGTIQSGLGLEYIFYKSPVKINIKMSPNKYNGDYFRHFIDKYKEIIDKKDWNYRNGEYISKYNGDKDIKKASDVDVYDSSKGQKIKTKYSTDIYKAIVVNSEYVICESKIYAIVRNPDDYSDVKLPVIGRAFNKVTKRPYSLIWATKGLQDFYNIVNYHRELMLNLAGTKSIIFDRSQKPSTMRDEEWEEQTKLGKIYIQTTDGNGNPIRTSFNQWGMHDLSVSPAIQFLNNILESIINTMGDIIGVPRQRKGNVVGTDQVGTFERSLERSMIVTEILYFESDEVLSKALTQLLNIATNYVYKNGGVFQYVTNDLGNSIVNVPKGFFERTSFDIYALSNNEDAKKMRDLKDLLMVGYKDKQLPFTDIVDAMGSESVNELNNKLRYFTDRAEKLNKEMAQSNFENQKKIEEDKIKLAQEYETFWKKQEGKYKEMELQLEDKKIQLDGDLRTQELILKGKEIALKYMELTNEQRSEDNAIAMNKYNTDIQAQITAMQTEINASLQLMQMDKDKDESDKERKNKKETDLKKIEVDKIKAKKVVKENVRD